MKNFLKRQLRRTGVVFVLLILLIILSIVVGQLFPAVIAVIGSLILTGLSLWLLGWVLWQVAECITEVFW